MVVAERALGHREEITFDYQWDTAGRGSVLQPCHCGAKRCRGVIGVKVQRDEEQGSGSMCQRGCVLSFQPKTMRYSEAKGHPGLLAGKGSLVERGQREEPLQLRQRTGATRSRGGTRRRHQPDGSAVDNPRLRQRRYDASVLEAGRIKHNQVDGCT